MAATMSRRIVMAGLGAAVAIGPPGRSRAADLPVVHVGLVPIFAVAPQIAADKFGYFTAEGIATTTQVVQGGAIGIPGLIGGSFDVLYSNATSVLSAIERGIDIRIIAEAIPITTHPPDPAALIQRKGSGLRSGRDLAGKTIGINVRYDMQWMVMQAWIDKTGGDLARVTYREVPLPSMLDALKGGQVDAALVLDPFLAIALEDPDFAVVDWPLSRTMPGLPSALWIVAGNEADTKGDLIRAYRRGFMKGVQWVNENLGTDAYLQLVAAYTKTDQKVLKKMAGGKTPTDVDAGSINRLAALMKEYGLLKTDIDVTSKVFKP